MHQEFFYLFYKNQIYTTIQAAIVLLQHASLADDGYPLQQEYSQLKIKKKINFI
jgi:hypothetical protein